MSCYFYGAGVCPDEKHCDGEKYVRCKISKRGIVIDKMRGEYRVIKSKSVQELQSFCRSSLSASLVSRVLHL